MSEGCNHGVTFDPVEAARIIRDTQEESSGDAGLDFIMGPTKATNEIRKRWPRGWFTAEKPCICGFVGIAYASQEHYL